MISLTLKTRFGLYAAALATLGVSASMLAVRPIIYRLQLAEVDRELASDAEELIRDLKTHKLAPTNFRAVIPEDVIPPAVRRRYVQIIGPEGQVLYTRNLRGQSLASHQPGFTTQSVMSTPPEGGSKLVPRNARIGTFPDGMRTIHLGTRLGTVEAMQDDLVDSMKWIVPSTAVAVFVIGWFLGHRALRPVSRLSAAAEKIDANRPEERLPIPPARDEIYRLTEVLNRSFDRLQTAYAAAARFSADASHQLKTPLAVLRAGLDSLRSDSALPGDQREEINLLLKQTRRLTTLVEDLLLLAQADAGRLQVEAGPFDLTELTRAMLDDLDVLCSTSGQTLEVDVPDSLLAVGDARRTALILQNLSENAAKYAGANGTIRITGTKDAGMVTVSVANTGPGIPPEYQARLFERFNRAGVGENIKGHGLGLNIARSLARAQNGDVRLVKSDGQWTEFQLLLPAAEK